MVKKVKSSSRQVDDHSKHNSVKVDKIQRIPLPLLCFAIERLPHKANDNSDFILTLCKATLYKIYMNSIKVSSLTSPNYIIIFQEKLRTRVSNHHRATIDAGDRDAFNGFWTPIAMSESGIVVLSHPTRTGAGC